MIAIQKFLVSQYEGVLDNDNLHASLDAMSELEINDLLSCYNIPHVRLKDHYPIQYTHVHEEMGLFIPCSIYKFVALQEKIENIILE